MIGNIVLFLSREEVLLISDYHRVWLCSEHRNPGCSSREKGKRNRGTLLCCAFTFGILCFWLHCIMNCQYANCPLFSMNDNDKPFFFFQAPPSDVQDKISFIINNISTANIESKGKEFAEILPQQYYPWFAQYMVMKRYR